MDISQKEMDAKECADAKRIEAKQLLNALLGFRDHTSRYTVDYIVDCIIEAAIMEVALIYIEAARQFKDEA